MKEKRKLKRWQGWALFVATMVVVFLSRSFSLVYYATPCRGCLYLCQ